MIAAPASNSVPITSAAAASNQPATHRFPAPFLKLRTPFQEGDYSNECPITDLKKKVSSSTLPKCLRLVFLFFLTSLHLFFCVVFFCGFFLFRLLLLTFRQRCPSPPPGPVSLRGSNQVSNYKSRNGRRCFRRKVPRVVFALSV